MIPSGVPWWSAIGGVGSTVLGSFFAGADTAITSLSSSRLAALLDEETKRPRRAAYERIRDHEAVLRSRYLLGRIACTCLTAVFFYQVFEPIVPSAGAYLAFAATVVLNATAFEISTTLARKHADVAAPIAARWLVPLEVLLAPLAGPLGWVGARLAAPSDDAPVTVNPRVAEAEVEILVEAGEKSGLFGKEPAEMIKNVLDFSDRTARDVMVPREKVEAIELETPLAEVLARVSEVGHSRYPVYRGRLDDIVGLVYAKDLFKALEEGGPKKKLSDLVRGPANFIAGSRPASTLLREMRRRRQHLDIVVDDLGHVEGIVTLEDVLEEIVGDIRDEHDEKPIVELGSGKVLADAALSISDLGTYLGRSIEEEGDGEYDSIGAMIAASLGKTPEVGAAIERFGLRFTVRDADAEHIGKVEVEPVMRESPDAERGAQRLGG